ncbi:MAG: 30S ribosomal protein S7 [Candidatus Bathyarchaeia archaeon]|nr:30S ribosomal protein S7 [Candidatus Bathyarchaeota archaeon]
MSKAVVDLKVFGKWPLEGVEVKDPGLAAYISLRPALMPHSGGRHEHQRFKKSTINIVERLVNNMMRHGRCGGKKVKAINIVRNAFEIIQLKTGVNPVQILIRALENSALCEEVTRIVYGGVAYPVSVDVSPQRRIDLALRFLCEGARQAALNNPKTIDECLAEEIILASERDSRSFAIKKRDEIERIALSSR